MAGGHLIASSRFGELASQPVPYTRVHPDVVVEVDADTAVEYGRFRIYRRLRLDLRASDLPGPPD